MYVRRKKGEKKNERRKEEENEEEEEKRRRRRRGEKRKGMKKRNRYMELSLGYLKNRYRVIDPNRIYAAVYSSKSKRYSDPSHEIFVFYGI